MTDRGRLLVGAFEVVDDAVAFAERVAVVEPDKVRQEWSVARDRFLAVRRNGRLSESSLDPETLSLLKEKMETTLFRQSVQNRTWRLANIPIAALITSQPYVNWSRVELMRTRIGVEESLASLMFPTATKVNVKSEVSDGPTIAFVSDRRELAFTSAAARRVSETGAIEVVMRIEPRPNYVSVVESDGRWIVRNGNHRLVAALEAGLSHVPCVVLRNPGPDLLETSGNKFRKTLLFSERPPLVADLAGAGPACIEVNLRRRRFTTSVRAGQESTYEE